MIQSASVGVGILGGENGHAVANSDIAIRRVTDLSDLVLVRGRSNWQRNAETVRFVSTTKAIVVFSILFHDIVNGFAAEALYTGTSVTYRRSPRR